MTALWIVLGCLGFILLLCVLLLTVHAHIRIQIADEFALTVRVFGIPFHLLPKKEKKYKTSDYTLKKIRKREKKQAKALAKKRKISLEPTRRIREWSQLTKAEKKARRPKLTEFVPLTAKVVRLFSSKFFGKLHVKAARLHLTVGGKDAAAVAVTYGMFYPALELLLCTLEKVCKLDSLKKADIQLIPDFTSEKITFEGDITLRMSLGNVLGALLKAGWAFLVGYNKIKPNPDEQAKPSSHIPLPPLPDFLASDSKESVASEKLASSEKSPQA